MIWTIAAREILDNLMSLRFLFGTVLCLALVVISTVVSVQDYQGRMDEYDSTLAQYNEQSYIWRVKILRKPEVLSIFVRGFDDRLGNVAQSMLEDAAPVASDIIGAEESRQRTAESASIDFLFIVRVGFSLLAIFLSYDAVSGEYERGTLKLMLSRPVSRASIILGKLIAGLVCLLMPLIMSFIIGVLIVQLGGSFGFTSEEWLRVVLIFGVSILCVTSFYMMGLVVSCRTLRAATSLLILLLIWIAGVFLIPGVTTAIVGRYRSMTPHPANTISAIYNDFRESNPRPDPQKMDRESLRKRMAKWVKLGQERDYSIWNVQKRYMDRLHSQADLVRWICRISPSESCAYAAEAMARTDVGAHRNFMRYVWSYHAARAHLATLFWADSGKFNEERDKYNEAVQSPPIEFSASLRSAAADICLLVIFNVLLLMLSVLLFIGYDVH